MSTARDSGPKPDSPGRVRAKRGYGDIRNFLEIATQDELRTFLNRFDDDDERRLLRKLTRENVSPESAKRRAARRARGLPIHAPVDSETFFTHVREFIQGRKSREDMLKVWDHLAALLGGTAPFIASVWDHLPASYKSKYVMTPPPPSRRPLGGGGRRRTHKVAAKPVAGFAVVHSVEKPWVKEPNYQRWLGKLKRHTAKVRKHGDDPNPMNMCLDSKICKGDLGIPRKLMPQFTSPRDIRSFTDFIAKRYGIKAVRGTRKAGQLRPSQEEIHRERVDGVKEDIIAKKLNPNVPLIVSEDGYVIDGHHRWAAYKSHEPGKKMPVLIVKDSARDVLSMAATWGAKHHQF